jgi:hypothetical protein
VSYTKVAEFQARGLIHVHGVMRLDGPDGPDSPPLVELDALAHGAAIATAPRRCGSRSPAGHTPVVLLGRPDRHRPITWGRADDQAGDVHPGWWPPTWPST